MGATFVVTLREGFEAALLLGIVYAYLDRTGRRAQYGYVTAGALLGALASVAAGLAVSFLSGPFLDLGPDVVTVLVIFVAVFVLTWHGWWMRQHARALHGDLQRRIDAAQATRRLWVVAVIAFTGVFREGAETVLFLWGLLSQASVTAGWSGLAGGLGGVAMAAVLGWMVFHGGRRVNLRHFFAVTSVLLVLLAAGMVSTGVGRLAALGVLPQTEPLWDTSAVLAEDGAVGGFLAGLVGYRARPSVLEAAGYVAYLVVAGVLLFGPRPGPRRREAQPPAPTRPSAEQSSSLVS